jgi:NAD(P)H dehydrogenase (quinone)
MVNVVEIYYTRTGNTERMAIEVERGAREGGAATLLKAVKEVDIEGLRWADWIIIGSPTYFGLPAYEVNALIDRSIEIRGELEDKLGAAFSAQRECKGLGNRVAVLAEKLCMG